MKKNQPPVSVTGPLDVVRVSKSNIAKIIGISAVFFLMTYSEGLHEGVRYFKYHYVVLLAMTVTLCTKAFLRRRVMFRAQLGTGTGMLCICFLLQVLFASVVSGRAHLTALHVVVWHVGCYVFFVILFSQCNKRHYLAGIAVACWSVYLISIAAFLVGLYIQHVGDINLPGISFSQSMYRGFAYKRMTSWCSSPNRTGPLFLYGIIAALILMALDRSVKHRRRLLMGAILLGGGVLLSGSRSAIVSAVVVLGIAGLQVFQARLRRREDVHRTLLAVGVLCVAIVGGLLYYPGMAERALDYTRLDESIIVTSRGVALEGREVVHSVALEVHRSAPVGQQLFGTGPGTIMNENEMSSHSGWLTVLVEEGIAGFILLVGVFAVIVFRLYKKQKALHHCFMLKRLYVVQLAFWVSFALLNISTAILPVPRADSLFMCMMLAMFAYLEDPYQSLTNRNGRPVYPAVAGCGADANGSVVSDRSGSAGQGDAV